MEQQIFISSGDLVDVFMKTAVQVKELLSQGALISGIDLGYPDPVGPFIIEIDYYSKEVMWAASKVLP